MLDLNYDELNQIIKKEINNKSIIEIIDICKKLLPLFDMIYKNCTLIPETNYEIKEENGTDLALSYLKDYHPIYYDETQRMLDNNEIHIANYSLDNAGCDSYTGEIIIGNNKNISDALNLIHELFHHFNLKPINKYHMENTLARELFGEAISIAAELDFKKRLENKLLIEDAKKIEIDYINDAIDSIKKIKVELVLIDLYRIYGKIDKKTIDNFVSNNKDNAFGLIVLDEVENVINNITSWGSNLKIPLNLKYSIGIIFGYYLTSLIEDNYEYWNKIYTLNDKLYEISFEDALNFISPNYDDIQIFNIFFKNYEQIKKAITI